MMRLSQWIAIKLSGEKTICKNVEYVLSWLKKSLSLVGKKTPKLPLELVKERYFGFIPAIETQALMSVA